MKPLHVRHQPLVADPLQQERLRRALASIMNCQADHPASCSVRPSVEPQPTAGRNDCLAGAIPPFVHSPTGLESVTHA
jgi:hypothetical protein